MKKQRGTNMKRDNEKLSIILLVTNIVTVIVGIITGFVTYRLGYCKALDERLDASECKPARKWV